MDPENIDIVMNIARIGDFQVILKNKEQFELLKQYCVFLPTAISMNGVELRPRITTDEILNNKH